MIKTVNTFDFIVFGSVEQEFSSVHYTYHMAYNFLDVTWN